MITFELSGLGPEKAALGLLLTGSRDEEARLKRSLEQTGLYKCAVTEVGAKVAVFRQKLVAAVMGVALECGVVSRVPSHLHALIHAAHEACQPFLSSALVEDLGVKVAIVATASGSSWPSLGNVPRIS